MRKRITALSLITALVMSLWSGVVPAHAAGTVDVTMKGSPVYMNGDICCSHTIHDGYCDGGHLASGSTCYKVIGWSVGSSPANKKLTQSDCDKSLNGNHLCGLYATFTPTYKYTASTGKLTLSVSKSLNTGYLPYKSIGSAYDNAGIITKLDGYHSYQWTKPDGTKKSKVTSLTVTEPGTYKLRLRLYYMPNGNDSGYGCLPIPDDNVSVPTKYKDATFSWTVTQGMINGNFNQYTLVFPTDVTFTNNTATFDVSYVPTSYSSGNIVVTFPTSITLTVNGETKAYSISSTPLTFSGSDSQTLTETITVSGLEDAGTYTGNLSFTIGSG